MNDMEFDDMRTQLDELVSELDELTANLDAAKAERARLQEQRKALREERKRLRTDLKVAKIARQQEEAERFQNDLDGLDAQLEAISDCLDSLSAEIDTTRDQYSDNLDTLEDMRSNLEDFQEELDDDDDADEDDRDEEDEEADANSWREAVNDFGAQLDEVFQKTAARLNRFDFSHMGDQISQVAEAAGRIGEVAGRIGHDAGKWAHEAVERVKAGASDESGDYSFSGFGTLSGGEYRDIRVSGSGKATEDIRCRNLRVSGSFKAAGAVECLQELRVSGSFKAEGNVKAQSLRISGAYKSAGDVEAEAISISGAGKIEGGVRGENLQLTVPGKLTVLQDISAREVHISGILHVDGACETEYYKSSGSQAICGLLNADTVELELCGDSTIADIGCTNLNVSLYDGKGGPNHIFINRQGSAVTIDRNDRSDGHLKVSTIEGDNVNLINTEAETVRGTNVTIGPGCTIGTLEYSGICVVSPDAEVGSCTRL